ncbi:hypothetical protein Clacol_003003 [Clathrus columnatus]|uniref:ATP-dependent DNA helicase II subunit 2 n=1 Tax=Clathrus columnatus TaxID=1419009 RepID=A0AAV5A7R1_9AGAM|nr:hypothetical protein Clacol_003003 [Clathrus columnatus]
MLNLFSGSKFRTHKDSDAERAPEGSDPDDTSILDEQEGSIITSIISQLRIGMDLQKVAFPTFVLEPRSMLERITDFMSHPELIFGAGSEPNPEERFIRVLQYYLAGWHVKPKGVKKPYNPVLGEFFRCKFDYPDGTQSFYIAEQVSHHPPITIYLYISPANKVRILGEIRPKSKFLGNSVSTNMEGENQYIITMPSMYARGILFGKMVLELGDSCVVKNEQTGLHCDIDFKTKGFFSGSYNNVVGKVKRNGSEIGEVSGRWSHIMEYKDVKTSRKRLLFDASQSKVSPKHVEPEESQEPNESRRLWAQLTAAILDRNMERAQESKSTVENVQREERRRREELGLIHTTRFFEQQPNGRWAPKVRVNEANGGYEHITEYIPISQPGAETMTKLQNIRPSTVIGDHSQFPVVNKLAIDGLIVGIETQDSYLLRKPTWTRKIVLLTDGENPMELEDWEAAVHKINDLNIKMSIVGVNFDDDYMPYHERNKSHIKRENEVFYSKFSKSLNECIVGTTAFALQECFRPDIKMTKSVLMKSKLRIGDTEGRPEEAIELNIRTSKCTAISRPPSLKKFAKRKFQPDHMDVDLVDTYIPLERKTEYVVQRETHGQDDDDDDKTEGGAEEIVEKEELVRGYKYGANFVPIEEEDEFERLEPNAGVDICGFFYASNYRREWSMGEVQYVWADPDSYEAQVAFSSIVKAMSDKDAMAIARWTSRSDPKMGILLPRVLDNVDCFLWVQVPFADDVRKYSFRSLDNLVTKNGEIITNHPHIPTETQLKAMDSFVDAMDLMTAGEEDEDGNRLPWYDPVQSYNPAIHRIKQALFHGAITSDLSKNPLPPPHPDLVKYLNPPEIVLKRSRDAVEECRKLFKIKPGSDLLLLAVERLHSFIVFYTAPPKVVKRRKDAHMAGEDDDELIDLGAPLPSRESVKHPSGNMPVLSPQKSFVKDDDSATEEDSDIEDLGKVTTEPVLTRSEEKATTRTERGSISRTTPSPKTKETVLPTPARSNVSASPPPRIEGPRRIVGISHPLRDFKENLKYGDIVTESVRDLGAVIKEVVMKPFASRRHEEMIQCMGEMRRVALEEDEIEAWNKFSDFRFLRDLKDSCLNQIPHNKEFWKETQKIGRPISLISSKEAKKAGGKSDVTEGTAVDRDEHPITADHTDHLVDSIALDLIGLITRGLFRQILNIRNTRIVRGYTYTIRPIQNGR